ncbi:Brefeldin A resistance protein-like protein [Hapsidospora chrysogenum ATCC 11550]|uniref:Brefeldin A resistance protein-like protein n=1 Tax=Hapsidospora chrysogenum (strain ATCC 11550 / CBS 779.69 / DSM 880 / IAM 14645 / JCM 23072 / IMI 49137) TaxID=857340 RepID=A0A086T5A9_HAPC1|nr:Brefeldin A resistance protein-like protein [Hapsidospora chrysogenum ATCC 11550]
MADSVPEDTSPRPDPAPEESREDAETRATRRELKQSSISDPAPADNSTTTASTASTAAADDDEDEDEDDGTPNPATPPADASGPKDDQILSPKKKRAHDQVEENGEAEGEDAKSTASTDSAKDRAARLEPEKKRHRDGDTAESSTKPPEAERPKSPEKKQPETSSSAFAASGFGKLATSSSPFAALAGSGGSAFGSAAAGTPSLGSFAAPVAKTSGNKPAEAPKLTFGGGSSASPFAGLASGTNGFGSALGGSGFGSAATGATRLGTFATPGSKLFGSEKPEKKREFGAPESDAESSGGEDGEGADDKESDEERAGSPEKEPEDKKKTKFQRIEVNDGEAGEATITSVRAKVFYLDKEAGWKERGSGMLKINVPETCVEFNDSGAPIPGSFDASCLDMDDVAEGGDAGGPKVARLIMRQDQTHRVILNTAILPAMKFQEKASLKSVGILFTAFEGAEAKPVNITVRMTAANAKTFMNEIGLIQRELQSN